MVRRPRRGGARGRQVTTLPAQETSNHDAVAGAPRVYILAPAARLRLVDGSRFHEFEARHGTARVCGFAHLQAIPVAILASQRGVPLPGGPCFPTARPWSDGVIDPAETRTVLAPGAASLHAPIPGMRFGVPRM